ncbi:glycosyl transferase family 2 [Ulvibacter sp. MAR_2010_11]|uniref:glycosyltransferase family 2 protein n=1 Tax=Ulvibacter sp. MAR_2010_11 TaxID=1250229 RepID=UPI000C2C32DB|nr:glycosyltransferase family 2 protein [Ulvibacter sp. MAR_2010_11]PKA82131.1 glycosyl transferase family 2 [Ulvibacter sp. MAR_2010_11]
MQENFPKISVVTPNYNQGEYIEETIKSVFTQSYPNLEYIIIDGGSTDQSISIIKNYEAELHYWESENDQGMYHAINKGFSMATGDIMCWINSDDVLWEGALFYVAKVFLKHPKVCWLQGYPSVIDEEGKLLFQRKPVATKDHFYSLRFIKDFSFIQQESTFWRKSLWEKAGGQLDTNFGLAADFELWLRFFKYESLYCSKKQLAAFRKRKGQKSGDGKKYLEEANLAVNQHLKKMTPVEKIRLKGSKFINKTGESGTVKWIESL